jgi:hypothetical protein
MKTSQMKTGMRVRFTRVFECDPMIVGNVTVPVGALATIIEVPERECCFVIVRPDDLFPDLAAWCVDEECDYELHVFDEDDNGNFPFEIA